MRSRYAEYIQQSNRGAFLWGAGAGLGAVYANDRGRKLYNDPFTRAVLTTACENSAKTARAEIVTTTEGTVAIVPLYDEHHAVDHVLAVEGAELSEVPAILHEVHGRSRRFSRIIDLLTQIVLTARPSGTFDFASRRWSDTVGTPEGLHDLTTDIVAATGEHSDFINQWRAGVDARQPFSFLTPLRTANGARWHKLRATPAFDGARLSEWVVTLDDVDEAVRARDQLGIARKRLEVLSEIGGIAVDHDVLLPESLRRIFEAAVQAFDAVWIGFYETGGRRSVVVCPAEAHDFENRVRTLRTTTGPMSYMHRWDGEAPRPVVQVPLVTGERGLHGVAVIGKPGAAPFDRSDLSFVRDIALRVGTSLKNRLAFHREERIAHTLQTAMLPVALPSAPGLKFDVVYRPAELETLVGGDWYDAFELADSRIAFSIGDVAGHGLEAATTMGQVRELLRVAAFKGATPSEAMAQTNASILAGDLGLVTSILGYIDPLTLDIEYASAGHAPPCLVSADGTVELFPNGDVLLGVTPAARYWTHGFTLGNDAALMLYTDGLLEATKNYDASEQQLIDVLREWALTHFAGDARMVMNRVLRGAVPCDDIAILLLHQQFVPSLDTTVPAEVGSSRRVRSAIGRILAGSPFRERSRDFVLAMGEAVNNAIEHGSRSSSDRIRFAVSWDAKCIRGTVESFGAWLEPIPADERGRGFVLMKSLTDRFDVEASSSGTTVHLRLDALPEEAFARP